MKVQLPEGYKVKFSHMRWGVSHNEIMSMLPVKAIRNRGWIIAAKGGETRATIYDKNDEFIATALASCSKGDNFNRRIGRDIALGRAMKKAGMLTR